MPDTGTLLANERFRERFDLLLERHLPTSFPALSVCVIYRGKILLKGAWGWLDPETRQLPVVTETRFDLASVTKIIVETSFLTLVTAGKTDLDDRLVDVVPEFARANPRKIAGSQDPHTLTFLPADEEFLGHNVDVTEVTFRHLLTHTSGLPPWCSVYLLAGDRAPDPPGKAPPFDSARWRKGLAAMLTFPFAGPIGDTVRYTDIGIMLLGEAVARLHGKRLDRASADLVLDPLKLSSFTYNPLQNGVPRDKIVPTEFDNVWRRRRAWGEVHDENACGVGGIAGHAGLFAKAEDVARFGHAWMSGDSRLRVSPELREEATRQHAQGQFRMGLGWMLKADKDSSAGDLYSSSSYGHTGFTGTSLWIDPDKQLVTAILTNRVYHGRDGENIHIFRRGFHDLVVTGIRDL